MKTSRFISTILAAGAAGVAGFLFAQSGYSAAIDGDVVLGAGAALAIAGLAIFDYSRRARPLTAAAPVLRPKLPARTARPAAAQFTRQRARQLVA